MEKQDILIVAAAILAVTILVLVIHPLNAGQTTSTPPGKATGTPTLPVPRTPRPRPTPTPTPESTLPEAPAVTETPPWNGSVKAVGFVGQPEGQVTLAPNPAIPTFSVQNQSLVTYATISNQWPGTTEDVYVPTPWWVLEYTAEPYALPPNAYPVLIIQVFDAQDPNRVVIPPIKQTIYEQPPDTPWSVKFYEGRRNYYFKIDTSFIKDYTLTIKVPPGYA